jgi:outer membrane receptor protein involved in Fe transport
VQGPNIIEEGRGTLDAKAQWKASGNWTVTLTGKNLTDNRVTFRQDTRRGPIQTGYAQNGIGFSLGVSHAR